MSPAPFGGLLPVAVIMSLIDGDTIQPRLKLTGTIKLTYIPNNIEEDLLADLFDILNGVLRTQLANKTSRWLIITRKEFIPSLRLALLASGNQLRFAWVIHGKRLSG